MKIIVAIKQVPHRDSVIRIDDSGKWIEEDGVSFEINEPDAYALEEALQLKDKHGGEVVVLCAGPNRATPSIREALAKGADRAIHIECDDLNSLDTLAVAERLAAAIREEKPDLILSGLQSDDLGLGQTGVVLAELLGIPHATIIMQVDVRENGTLRVKRELEAGWFQWIEMPLPALLTIQSGISKLRYATLLGIKKAKTKDLRCVTPQTSSCRTASAVLERVYLPEKKKETQILDGPPDVAAAKLVEKLQFEVKVI